MAIPQKNSTGFDPSKYGAVEVMDETQNNSFDPNKYGAVEIQKKSDGGNGLTTSAPSTSQSVLQDVPDFGMKSFKDLATGNQSRSDNTTSTGVQQSVLSDEERMQHDERAATKKANLDKAITNTAINSLKIKGIKPTAVQVNQEKQKYQQQVDNGDASVALNKDGTPGLKRVTGGLENLVNGWNEATSNHKENADFIKMSTQDKVGYLNNHPEQDKVASEYMGEKPSGWGEVTHFVGGAGPYLGKAFAAGVLGSVMVAAAPETLGASLVGLPLAMSILATTPDAINSGMADEIKRRYSILKKEQPNRSDIDLMKEAEQGGIAGGIGGGLSNIAMMGIGGGEMSATSKSLLANTVKHILKSSAEIGGISGAATGLVQEEGNLEGIKTSQSDIAKNVGNSIKDNATQAFLLTSLIHGVPNVLKSVSKYALVKDANPEEIKQTLDINVANGTLPPETADKVMTDLSNYKQALDKTPNGLSPDSQASVAGLIQKRTNIEKEAKTKDVTAQSVYKPQIDAINQQIEDIQRTGKPLEHEIDEATGKPYKQPTFDDVAKSKVEDLADKIAKGKRIEEPEDLQAEANFPEELTKQLERLKKQEAPKEDETQSDAYKNINKYISSQSKTENNGKNNEANAPGKTEGQINENNQGAVGKTASLIEPNKEVSTVSDNELTPDEENKLKDLSKKSFLKQEMTQQEQSELARIKNKKNEVLRNRELNNPFSKEFENTILGTGKKHIGVAYVGDIFTVSITEDGNVTINKRNAETSRNEIVHEENYGNKKAALDWFNSSEYKPLIEQEINAKYDARKIHTDQNINTNTPEEKQSSISNFPKPEVPIHEMNSEQLDNYAKKVKDYNKNLEIEFFGESGAKKYREAQSISNNSLIHSSDPRYKEANALIDKMEASLTPEQQNEFYAMNAPDGLIYDHSEIKDIATKVRLVEEAENIDELSSSVKAAVGKMNEKSPSNESLAILNAAKKKAIELGIDPKKLIGEVLKKVGKQYKDAEDAALMMKTAFDKLSKPNENNLINDKEKQSSISVIQPEDNKPNNNVTEVGKTDEPVTENTPENKPPLPPTDNIEGGKEGDDNLEVGISHDALSALAKRFGLSEPERGTYETPEDQANKGRKLLNDGADVGAILTKVDKGGALNADEISVLRAHLEDLTKKADDLRKKNPNSEAYKLANQDVATLSKIIKKSGTEAGKSLYSFVGTRNVDEGSFTSVSNAVENETGKPVNTEQQKKIDELTTENTRLKKEASDLDKKTVQETDKNIGKKTDKSQSIKEAGKKLAENIRKGKLSRPDIFSSASPGSLVWDGALEIAAKTVETTADIAQAIADGLDHIKNSTWYKNLGTDKQKEAEKAFSDFIDKPKKSTEQINIERLQKELTRLQEEGTLKDKSDKRELSDKENDLQKQIVDEQVKIQKKDLIKQFADKRPKDKKFTPEEANSLWDYGKKKYLNNGVSYIGTIQKVSDDTGLTLQQVAAAFETPKTKPISDANWAKQREVSRSKLKVNDYIDNQNMNPILKFVKGITKIPKGVATFLHGHIFPGTHYPMGFVTPSQWGIYFNGIGKSWRNAYGTEAYHAKEVAALSGRPLYTVFQKAGLQNDVNNTNIDDFEKGGKLFGAIGRTGTKGFLGMKWIRQMMAEDYYNAVPENERTKNVVETIAYLVNRATQASNVKIPPAVQELFFSAGMEGARWGKLFISPPKAIAASTRILTNMAKGHEVAPEDKVFVKVWGSRVGQQLGTLVGLVAANAYIQSKINPKNPVNLTDPTKNNWLKLKVDNTDVDLSGGVLGIKNFLTSVATYAINDKNARKEVDDIGGKSVSYIRGKLSPLYGDVADVTLGTDYKGNPLPFRDKTVTAGHHKLGWGEYLTSKAPIFIANAMENLYSNAEDNGIPKSQTDKIVNGIISGAITTGTGVHTMASYQPAPKKTFTIYNEETGTKREATQKEKDQYDVLREKKLEDKMKGIENKDIGLNKYGDVTIDDGEIVTTKKGKDLTPEEKTKLHKSYTDQADREAKDELFYMTKEELRDKQRDQNKQ